jgi:hypothetical protein
MRGFGYVRSFEAAYATLVLALASALPMIAGIAFGVGWLASFVLAVSELMQAEVLSPAPQFFAGPMLLAVA